MLWRGFTSVNGPEKKPLRNVLQFAIEVKRLRNSRNPLVYYGAANGQFGGLSEHAIDSFRAARKRTTGNSFRRWKAPGSLCALPGLEFYFLQRFGSRSPDKIRRRTPRGHFAVGWRERALGSACRAPGQSDLHRVELFGPRQRIGHAHSQ